MAEISKKSKRVYRKRIPYGMMNFEDVRKEDYHQAALHQTQLIARALITEFHMETLLNLMTFSLNGFLPQTSNSREKGLMNAL